MKTNQNIFNLAYRYTRALSRWIKAGRPVRSEADIEWIYEMYCKPCEVYENGKCDHCGCAVNLLRSATQNKIAMATEECPLGKWKNNKAKTDHI